MSNQRKKGFDNLEPPLLLAVNMLDNNEYVCISAWIVKMMELSFEQVFSARIYRIRELSCYRQVKRILSI